MDKHMYKKCKHQELQQCITVHTNTKLKRYYTLIVYFSKIIQNEMLVNCILGFIWLVIG